MNSIRDSGKNDVAVKHHHDHRIMSAMLYVTAQWCHTQNSENARGNSLNLDTGIESHGAERAASFTLIGKCVAPLSDTVYHRMNVGTYPRTSF